MKKIIKLSFYFILICLILFITGCGTQYLGGNRDEMWIKDLNYLQKALSKKHPNLFVKISENDFNNEINNLKENVDNLNDDEIVNEIYKIVASVGDAHTKAYNEFPKRYPLQFYYFDDDLYLINTIDEYKQALNCKLKKINGIKISEIENLLKPMIAHENEANIKKTLPTFLSRPDILRGEKIIDKIDSSKFTFENLEGKEFELNIEEVDIENNKLEFIDDGSYDESYPLYMQQKSLNYWYKYLEDKNILYFKYNVCLPDEEAGDINNIIVEIIDYINSDKVNKLVIDMRNNSGGTDGYINELIENIKEKSINDPNRLYLIVGRETFSSAIIDACKLSEETNATIIGEPTSGKPNHYGSTTKFELPNSKILVTCSTKEVFMSKDNRESLIPDKIIETNIKNYINKKDPVIDYILK